MKCLNCNTELNNNETICPNCGKDVTLPPELDVNKENLTEGISDIGSSEVSDYIEVIDDEVKPEIRKKDDVEILIPSVEKKEDNEINEESNQQSEIYETIGEVDEFVEFSEDVKAIDRKNPLDKIIVNIKNTKVIPKNVFIICVFVFLVLGLFTGKVAFSKNYCATPVIRDVGNSNIKSVSDGSNNETAIGGYLYKIPNSFTYDRSDSGIRVYSGDDSWVIFIKSINGNFQNIIDGRVSVRETLKTSLSVGETKELTISDSPVITFETTENVTNRLIAFTKAPNDNIFYMEIYSTSNNFNYDVLEIAMDIAVNATAIDKVTNMENYEVLDKAELSLKAADTYAELNKKVD